MVRFPRSRWSALAALPLLVLLAGWPAHNASAASFTVTKFTDSYDGYCDADCSLREAIVAASLNAGADTITLAAGTYTLSLASGAEDYTYGDLNVWQDLTITGAGAGITVINAQSIDRVFEVTAGLLSLSGLTVRGGLNDGDGGAGISCTYASLSLVNVAVEQNNTDGYGGGIRADECPLSISQSYIQLNNGYGGAGVYAGSGSTLTMDRSYVIFNTAETSGGGLDILESNATITNSWIATNTATAYDGGGVYFHGFTHTLGISGTLIADNFAGREGGGAYVLYGTSATIENSTISSNQTAGYAGGLDLRIPVTIRLSTIVNNVADSDDNGDGGTGGLMTYGTGAAVTLADTIIANNTQSDPPVVSDCWPGGGTITSLGYNLVETVGDCTFAATGDITGVDPLLGPLQSNGGFTWSHAPNAGSPVIDAGDPALSTPPAFDQRGAGFPRLVGRVDIGAVEYVLRVFLPLILKN